MADVLSLIRQYNIEKKPIVENDGKVIFGEYFWEKTAKTNYMIYKTDKDGPPDYYTVECILFLLKNVKLQHPMYVRQAANQKIPMVTRADRKDLLDFLNGAKSTSTSIDHRAMLEMPQQVKKHALEESLSTEAAAKKPKISQEDAQREKDLLFSRLQGHTDTSAQDKQPIRSLGSISADKIAALRAKHQNKKKKTIQGVESIDAELTAQPQIFDSTADITRDVLARERVWRNRVTILECPGKDFSKTVFSTLHRLKAREHGHGDSKNQSAQARPAVSAVVPNWQQKPQEGYNRYKQEIHKRAAVDMGGFNINPQMTYQGINLKQVTEQPASALAQQSGKSGGAASDPRTARHASAGGGGATPRDAFQRGPGRDLQPISAARPQQRSRGSKTPIIVIPGVLTSLITMYNAKDLLQDFNYVATEVKKSQGVKKENEVLIQRRHRSKTDPSGQPLTVPYRVVDNTSRFDTDDWNKVVAVFVQGPAWQFKNWPWNANPVEIFDKIKAFHLKYDEAVLDSNISGWSVTVLSLSKMKRHLDRPLMIKFWNELDSYCLKNKPNLRT